ncbi:MAG: type I methionyl aminopeptidase [Aerococcus sp.]|nr:type I methionyl aminopeptidase [Aerococcus sp.]
MITLKSKREIEGMDRAGSILAHIHEEMRDFIRPGVTTMEVNDRMEELIRKAGAIPEQIDFEGYPYATCTSPNDVIAHGFPDNHFTLKNGDLLSLDTVISIDGYFSDSCWSYEVGEVSDEVDRLMDVTLRSLYLGIEQCVPGKRIGDIGHAIQTYAEGEGYSVVREFVGHGIQPTMHEEPMVPHYGTAGRGLRLKEGMTLTVEPMINTGDWRAKVDDNGWTARTVDGSLSCQFEHTFVITADKPKILTMQSLDKHSKRLNLDDFAIDYNFDD